MAFSIQTNINSITAQENLRVNSTLQSQTIQRLTSGLRINSSADDAAGLSIANKFRNDTDILTQGVRNANDGAIKLQIADGGLNNIGQLVDRMKTLAMQSASDDFTGDRDALNKEYNSLVDVIDRQAKNVGLGDSKGKPNFLFSIPAMPSPDSRENKALNFTLTLNATSSGLGLDKTSIASKEDASKALETISNATKVISDGRAQITNGQDKFGAAVSLAQSQLTSFISAESRIRDNDFVYEAASLSKAQVLMQAGISSMAQANQSPQAILSLLRG